MSYESLAKEVDLILKAEGIMIVYEPLQSEPGSLTEGEYIASEKKILIDKDLQGMPDEPILIAHELGQGYCQCWWMRRGTPFGMTPMPRSPREGLRQRIDVLREQA